MDSVVRLALTPLIKYDDLTWLIEVELFLCEVGSGLSISEVRADEVKARDAHILLVLPKHLS